MNIEWQADRFKARGRTEEGRIWELFVRPERLNGEDGWHWYACLETGFDRLRVEVDGDAPDRESAQRAGEWALHQCLRVFGGLSRVPT